MKKIVLVFMFTLVLFPALAAAQIPNAGFESWAAGEPASWTTTNYVDYYVPVTQTNTAHSGFAALKGTVVSYFSYAYPPFVWSGFPIAQRYSTLSGWYTFSPIGGDSLYGWAAVFKSGAPIGYAFFGSTADHSTYTQFNATLNYFQSGTPDSCAIWLGIAGSTSNSSNYHEGSMFTVDDLSLSGTATGIAVQPTQPVAFALSQNFPNPFNPSTLISYQLASTGPVRLTVYDILGREVATLVDGIQPQGTHEARFDGGGLSSGVYLYRLQTNGFVQQRKMVLQK